MQKEDNFVINKKKIGVIVLMIILLVIGIAIGSLYANSRQGVFKFSIFNVPTSQYNEGAPNICQQMTNLNFGGECKGEWRERDWNSKGVIDCKCFFELKQVTLSNMNELPPE